MAQTAPKVSFPDTIKLPTPPKIVGIGTVTFHQSGQESVTFPHPVISEYAVFITGDGSNGGAIGRSSAVFTVPVRTPQGFTIQSSDNNCRQVVSWIAMQL